MEQRSTPRPRSTSLSPPPRPSHPLIFKYRKTPTILELLERLSATVRFREDVRLPQTQAARGVAGALDDKIRDLNNKIQKQGVTNLTLGKKHDDLLDRWCRVRVAEMSLMPIFKEYQVWVRLLLDQVQTRAEVRHLAVTLTVALVRRLQLINLAIKSDKFIERGLNAQRLSDEEDGVAVPFPSRLVQQLELYEDYCGRITVFAEAPWHTYTMTLVASLLRKLMQEISKIIERGVNYPLFLKLYDGKEGVFDPRVRLVRRLQVHERAHAMIKRRHLLMKIVMTAAVPWHTDAVTLAVSLLRKLLQENILLRVIDHSPRYKDRVTKGGCVFAYRRRLFESWAKDKSVRIENDIKSSRKQPKRKMGGDLAIIQEKEEEEEEQEINPHIS